ncbi:ABC transporter permease subunit [Enterococcus sp. DIV0242_7C1]|uniref:Uncharacterized protein n=1 Tax=Candidatus Enterococcus dunnyi TaxID=1834192 RepID=A0A200JCR4_9ENTE|nr:MULTISPECIES: ABC transporter permease subunit [unclassified Enterococcus]MBO0469727.1 ABC transporter permease subunit [Enterococcus sp. DIV0242_7C1]OUZ34984.1 hypothetical protein A5889_000459 [Enterococcus sp. 9D6_DIV0238]
MTFEWKKWSKQPKNILLLVCLIFSVFLSLGNLHYKNQTEDQAVFDHLKAINDEIDPPQGYAGPVENYKLLQLVDGSGTFIDKNGEQMKQILIDIVYLLEDENTAQINKDWMEKTSIQTERLKLQQKYLDLGGEEWKNETNIKEKLERNNWLLTRGLSVIDLSIGQQGISFVYYLLNNWTNYLLLIVIGLFFFDYLTAEYERRNYLFLAVQPVSKKAVYKRKFMLSALVAIGVFLGLLLLGFVVASFFYGMGSAGYPITIHTGKGFYFIPMWQYLVESLFLQILFILFVLQLLQLLAIGLKNSLEVLSLFLVVVLVPNILANVLSLPEQLTVLFPLFYMDSNLKVTMLQDGSYLFKCCVLLVWNLVLGIVWNNYLGDEW